MTNTIHANLDTLKIVQCPKLSAAAEGQITYHILRHPTDKSLYIAIMGNEGGGYFSQEAVPLDKIEQCLQELQATGKPFPAIRLKSVFVGKSANNPSFMAAALRHEQLLVASTESPKLHLPSPDLPEWRERIGRLPALPQPTVASTAPAANTEQTPVPAKATKSKDKSAGKTKPSKDAATVESPVSTDAAGESNTGEDHENDPQS